MQANHLFEALQDMRNLENTQIKVRAFDRKTGKSILLDCRVLLSFSPNNKHVEIIPEGEFNV